MIKPTTKSIIFFSFWTAFAFAFSFLLGLNLVATLMLVLLCIYLKLRKGYIRFFRLTHLILLFLIILTISYYIEIYQLPIYIIPFSIMPMLATLLFASLEISLLLTIACAIGVASIFPDPLVVALLFLTSGLLSSMIIFNTRKRSTIMRAGFAAGLIQVGSLILLERFNFIRPENYLILFLNGFASSILVLGTLPVFEFIFRTVTNISLLELADFNHPLLQKMVIEAPGTYHHSLIVGNLSESACQSIGANALLARIGAYYHDIGKIQKPNYFSENQADQSKHDTLTPSMSKMIIMNHVKEGTELAKKYRLNQTIIDFIEQHHGNSLVYYFYRRALENLEDDDKVLEEGFRYPGPKPNTKETAIVLLADSVEAATRALKDHTPKKIEELVHKIINNKFIDRQLDECDLTLKDLEKISEVFIRILSAIYHSRASYPEESKSADNNLKKSTKEDSDK